MTSPRALVIAGLDPSGGAGLLLDTFVLARFGFAPAVVATTLTAQDSADFHRAVPVDSDLVAEQIEAVCAEGPFACVKVGAVGSTRNARLLGSLLHRIGAPIVVDPVLVSSSGGSLLEGENGHALDALCSIATVVTPNAEEAVRLAGTGDADDEVTAREAGGVLAARWRCAVVVTGGAHGAEAADMLCERDSIELLAHPLVPDVGDVRGTGCMFSTSLAAGLGEGLPVRDAAIGAQRAVEELIHSADRLGRGRMQVDLGALCRPLPARLPQSE